MSNTGRRLVYSTKKKPGALKHKTYTPHFLDIIAARCTKEIEEAKQRVTVTKEGKYKYEPSKDYVRFLKHQCKK
jgi:hypothetical protein